MTTEFTPRRSRFMNDERDWYDYTLGEMRDQLCSDRVYPFATTDGERDAATYIARKAVALFIYQFEPALADLHPSDARWRADHLAHCLISGTHPNDLNVEAHEHYDVPESRTTWGPKAEDVLADADIDTALANRYGLDTAQANQLRERMGLPTVPDPDDFSTFTAPDDDW